MPAAVDDLCVSVPTLPLLSDFVASVASELEWLSVLCLDSDLRLFPLHCRFVSMLDSPPPWLPRTTVLLRHPHNVCLDPKEVDAQERHPVHVQRAPQRHRAGADTSHALPQATK